MQKYYRFIPLLLLALSVIFIVDIAKNGSSVEAAISRGYQKVSLKFAASPAPAVLLEVTFHRQEHSLSCEAAALKMALDFQGVHVAEKELIDKVGFDETPKRNGIWGDPQKAFVGDIDGKMMIDGYGVYSQPIARVASEYRYAIAKEGADMSYLISELQNGNPVIVWSYLATGKPFSWKNPEGNVINAVYGEHVRVLRGFAGDPSDPTGFFSIDPIYGSIYETKDEFLKRWGALGNQIVVVY